MPRLNPAAPLLGADVPLPVTCPACADMDQGSPCSERDRSCFCSSAPCPHSHQAVSSSSRRPAETPRDSGQSRSPAPAPRSLQEPEDISGSSRGPTLASTPPPCPSPPAGPHRQAESLGVLKLFMWNQEGGGRCGGTRGGDQAPGAGAPSMSCRMVGPGGANLGLRGALVPRPGKEREGQRDQEGAGEGQMRGLRAAAGGAESTFHRFPGWVGQTQAPWPRGRNGDPRGHLENRGKPQCGTDTEGRGLSQSREGSPGPRGWEGPLLPAA